MRVVWTRKKINEFKSVGGSAGPQGDARESIQCSFSLFLGLD